MVTLWGDDEDDERIFCILLTYSPCCIFILVWEAHYENIIYAVLPSSTRPVLLSGFVCFIHLQSAEVMSLNLTSWRDGQIFTIIFRCIVKSMLRIPKLVIVRPGCWMLHWMWRIAGRGRRHSVWDWCYMTSPHTQHPTNQVFQTLKLRFNNLEGNWVWGGSQVWDHDITDIVVQRSPRTFLVFCQPHQQPTTVMESLRWRSAAVWC